MNEDAEKDAFPMRLNRYLARQGYATRREADELIAKKRVLVNGQVAVIGQKVAEGDEVRLRERAQPVRRAYVLFHKPAGVDTHPESTGTKHAAAHLPPEFQKFKIFPVGRLDKDSSGLMLLTDDGRVTDRLLNPEYEHEKEYVVETKEKLASNFKKRMEGGVNIEGYVTEPCRVEILGTMKFRVVLTEGKKHQIRRMVVALGNQVRTLKRTRIGSLHLGKIPAGSYRVLEGDALAQFLDEIGLAPLSA